MRVRPFFWLLLTAVCVSVLLFSATISANKTIPMHVHIHQISTPDEETALVLLHVADTEGIPIEEAHIIPDAYMPAMNMGPQSITIQALGQGLYLTRIHFSMGGSWQVDITALAKGFAKTQESIQLTVI